MIYGRIEKIIDIILRIPGLFIIDNYCHNLAVDHETNFAQWSLIISNIALINGVLLLLLPLSQLKRYYLHLTCCILLLLSICLSYDLLYVDTGQYLDGALLPFPIYLNNESNVANQNLILYLPILVLHSLFNFISLSLMKASLRTKIIGCFSCTFPMVCHTLQLSTVISQILNCISYFIFCYILTSYSFKYLPILLTEMKQIIEIIIITNRNEGFNFLCLKTFQKIFVPVHFLLFWMITFTFKLYQNIVSSSQTVEHSNLYYMILSSVSAIHISPVSLISTAIAVTYLSCLLLSIIKLYLWGTVPNFNNVPSRDHNGWEEGMTTLLLTTITTLTDMNENARMAVLIIISFVVLSSLLQSMLEISEPAILSLNTNYNNNRIHHLKVLLLCAFLFCSPLYVTYVLAQMFPVNFWIAVVLSTSLLISARVLDLVIIHCLFWWDSCQPEPWEYLDEVVYVSRSLTKILEFIIAISVVVVGLWEAMNKRSNLLNSSILILHCYFNVWQRIKDGLRSYIRRREANRTVNSLMFADATQISKCNDLCSICFLEMNEKQTLMVTITKCNHLFHRLCIKKWLCIQNRCPLCTSIISSDNSTIIKN